MFTFPHSTKHVGLYQKFGYWPEYLTALMVRGIEAEPSEPETKSEGRIARSILSRLSKGEQEKAIKACRKLSDGIEKSLDLSEEIRSVLAQHTGDVVLAYGPENWTALRSACTDPVPKGAQLPAM